MKIHKDTEGLSKMDACTPDGAAVPHKEEHRPIHNNNVLFNQRLNRCRHPRQVCLVLLALAEPGVEQPHDMAEKRKVLVGKLLTGLDIAEGDKQSI